MIIGISYMYKYIYIYIYTHIHVLFSCMQAVSPRRGGALPQRAQRRPGPLPPGHRCRPRAHIVSRVMRGCIYTVSMCVYISLSLLYIYIYMYSYICYDYDIIAYFEYVSSYCLLVYYSMVCYSRV